MNYSIRETISLTLLCLGLLVVQGCASVEGPSERASGSLLPKNEISMVRREARKLIQGMLDEELVRSVVNSYKAQ